MSQSITAAANYTAYNMSSNATNDTSAGKRATAARPDVPPYRHAQGDAQFSAKARWTGRVLSGLAVAFLTFDTAFKLFFLPLAAEATGQLGYPASVIFPIGLIEVACLIVYLIPRTSVLGAILWTGYLGGAIATHVRIGSPLFTHTLFPIYVAALLWAGLWLRDRRVRALLRAAA